MSNFFTEVISKDVRFNSVERNCSTPPRYSGLQANLYMGTSVEEVQTRL